MIWCLLLFKGPYSSPLVRAVGVARCPMSYVGFGEQKFPVTRSLGPRRAPRVPLLLQWSDPGFLNCDTLKHCYNLYNAGYDTIRTI